jgi:Rad3-related DNA helicase
MPTIIDAARALLGRCDGAVSRDDQGFNGADAPFVRDLFERRWLTKGQLGALHKLLRKYSVQLSSCGIIYADLAMPTPGPTTSATGGVGTPNVIDADELKRDVSEVSDARGAQTGQRAGAGVSDQDPVVSQVSIQTKERLSAPAPWRVEGDILTFFPPSFTPRPQQEIAIRKIDEAFAAGKRVVVLEMPTGGGKSFAVMTLAEAVRRSGGKTCAITAQRLLQDQYEKDFPAPFLEILKGRSNYGCTHPNATDEMTAATGVCKLKNKGILADCVDGDIGDAVGLILRPEDHRCPYWKQLQKVNDNAVALFNFSSFLFQKRIGRFGHYDLMLIDEAHGIEGQLLNYVSMELTEWALSIIGVTIDQPITTKKELLDWLREKRVMEEIGNRINLAESVVEDVPADLSQAEAEALQDLGRKIEIFLGFLDKTDWHIETEQYEDRGGELRKKIKARPYYAKDFANDLLFSKATRVLAVSATILDKHVWASNLGFKDDEVELIQTPCDFPVESRPIWLEYAGNMGRKWFSPEENPKSPTKPKFVSKVKQILKRHEGQRGIVHCHSFALSKVLRDEVASDRFIFQDQFESKNEMLDAHAERPDSVIVAPAFHEGLDLKDDLSRFQIIAKVPWPNLGDPIVKERCDRDGGWFGWLTALKIVQSYGRSVRSKDDWAMTYIVDSGFDGFFARNAKFIPGWVKEALRKGSPTSVRK